MLIGNHRRKEKHKPNNVVSFAFTLTIPANEALLSQDQEQGIKWTTKHTDPSSILINVGNKPGNLSPSSSNMWIEAAFLVILFLLCLIYAFPYYSPRTYHKKRIGGGGRNRTELNAVFSTIDRNGDGFISKQELAELVLGSGMDMGEGDISDEFEKVDSNGDGLIDLEEFYGIFESREKEKTRRGEEEELREAFDVFDGNGDGLITEEELGLMLRSLGMKEVGYDLDKCREMIKSVDRDGDGMVNFEEFRRMMMMKTAAN